MSSPPQFSNIAPHLNIAKILVADNHLANLELLGACLQDTGYHILLAEDGATCLHLVREEKPDVVLLDIMMPKMNGFDVCQQLKADPLTWNIPIIILSALSNIENKIKGFRLGAADYINKPFQVEEVLVRVNTQVHLCAMRKQLEHQNQLLQEQAKQLQQRAQQAQTASQAKSRFMAMSSHDLRQPLHALSLLLETLGSKLENQHLQVLIQRVRQSITALSSLFNTLLDISQLDAEKIQPCIETLDLNQITHQLQEEFTEKAHEKGLVLEFAYCPKTVRSDPSLLKRILQNLISNAIRYTPQGLVKIDYEFIEAHLRIQIKDTGIGIAEDQQVLIFEEFYRIECADIEQNGLGLGLNIVKRLAELLHHPLHLQSHLGEGSCFSLTVPCVINPAEQASEPVIEVEADSLHIAVLDEDADTLAITLELLEDWGHNVLAADDTHQLLSALEDNTIDLFLSDFKPSQSNGLQLMQEVRKKLGYPVPTLFMTAETSLHWVAEMKMSGATVLFKPVNPEHLYEALQNYSTQQRAE